MVFSIGLSAFLGGDLCYYAWYFDVYVHIRKQLESIIFLKIESFNCPTFPILQLLGCASAKLLRLQGELFSSFVPTYVYDTYPPLYVYELRAALQIGDVTDSDFGARLEFRSV